MSKPNAIFQFSRSGLRAFGDNLVTFSSYVWRHFPSRISSLVCDFPLVFVCIIADRRRNISGHLSPNDRKKGGNGGRKRGDSAFDQRRGTEMAYSLAHRSRSQSACVGGRVGGRRKEEGRREGTLIQRRSNRRARESWIHLSRPVILARQPHHLPVGGRRDDEVRQYLVARTIDGRSHHA